MSCKLCWAVSQIVSVALLRGLSEVETQWLCKARASAFLQNACHATACEQQSTTPLLIGNAVRMLTMLLSAQDPMFQCGKQPEVGPHLPNLIGWRAHCCRRPVLPKIIMEQQAANSMRCKKCSSQRNASTWHDAHVLSLKFFQHLACSSILLAHADKMTLLGPRPIIASLSLGAGRVFRLRPAAVPPCVKVK